MVRHRYYLVKPINAHISESFIVKGKNAVMAIRRIDKHSEVKHEAVLSYNGYGSLATGEKVLKRIKLGR